MPAQRGYRRPISQEVYGVPRDRVIGSAIALEYVSKDGDGTIIRKAEADYPTPSPADGLVIRPRQVCSRGARPRFSPRQEPFG